jgi:hypothetical protein
MFILGENFKGWFKKKKRKQYKHSFSLVILNFAIFFLFLVKK